MLVLMIGMQAFEPLVGRFDLKGARRSNQP